MPKDFIHPYMPNSVPAIKNEMLAELGVESIKDIYSTVIPEDLQYHERLNLPEPIMSEYELKKHVDDILNKNITTEEYASFLGAGCYKHFVPALCDEINSRGEFLTGYCGDTYSDHGKMQAIFEYTSMMGELLDLDVVSYTNYEGGQAVTSSLRTALRIQEAAGRDKTVLLVPSTMNPEILSQATEYCRHLGTIETVAHDPKTGLMDLADLKAKLAKKNVAAVFYENPSYLGFIETQCQEIADLAHAEDAVCIAQPEVASLGIMESPANYGADIVCGDIQPFGMHMQYGGGQAGFMACAHRPEYIAQFPTYMYGICETEKEGVYGWGRAQNYRCSHASREKANEYFGTETGLWGITAGVYLATVGPQGLKDVAETTIQNANYLVEQLASVKGVKANFLGGAMFQEFVVNFDDTAKSVREINKALLEYKIFGGKDLSKDFPELGQSALYCVTEVTTVEQMDALVDALKKIVGGC